MGSTNDVANMYGYTKNTIKNWIMLPTQFLMCKLEFKAKQVNQTEHDIGRQSNLSQEKSQEITVDPLL